MELANYQRLTKAGHEWPHLGWLVDDYVMNGFHWGRLVCVDNLAHAGTSAHLLEEVAEALGLDDLLEVLLPLRAKPGSCRFVEDCLA